ncbi:MAG TPA: amidohydrolase family protein, partial [Gemmataceae bacterium]
MSPLPLLLLAPLLPAQPPAGDRPVAADVVVRNVTLFDGTGKPGVRGALAVRGDRIVGVGTFKVSGKPRVIDGTGLYAAPGFIDLHTHCDTGSPSIRDEKGRKNQCYLWQGVTTAVTGNCGAGPVDVAAFYSALEKNGVGTNVAHQVPHNAVRSRVMGNANRRPSETELRAMKALVDRGMKDGAWGLATGLIYNPGTYAETEEIIELARVAAEHGGIYASHIRNEGTGLLAAVEEALRIGREAKLPVHISHFKSSGRKAWGKCVDAIALVEQARANGQAVTADQYPYYASSTSLQATLVPARYREGTREQYRQRLDDPELGPRIRKAVEEALGDDGGQRILIARYRPKPEWQGKRLGEVAAAEGKSVLDVALEIERNGGAQIVHFSMREEDVRIIMKQPFVATASD